MERSPGSPKIGPTEACSLAPSGPPIEKQYRVPEGYVNRQMLRDLAGVTEHELKSLEGHRLVKAVMKNGYGWRLYTKDQIDHVKMLGEQLRAAREAREVRDPSSKLLPIFRMHAEPYSLEEYGQVIAALDKQIPLARIPIETKMHPAIVNVILRDSGQLSGALFVDKLSVDKLNALPLPGDEPIDSVESLLRMVKLLANLLEKTQRESRKDRKCETCHSEPRSICKSCVGKALEEVVMQMRGAASEAPATKVTANGSPKGTNGATSKNATG